MHCKSLLCSGVSVRKIHVSGFFGVAYSCFRQNIYFLWYDWVRYDCNVLG